MIKMTIEGVIKSLAVGAGLCYEHQSKKKTSFSSFTRPDKKK